MKILNINSYYYSSTVHSQLDSYIKEQGINTSSYIPVEKDYQIRKECQISNSEDLIYSKCYKKIDRFCFFLKEYKVLIDLYSKIEVGKYQIIHAHSLFSNGFLAYMINKKFETPYIVAVRDTDINFFLKYRRYLQWIGLNIVRNAEKVVFLSKPYRVEFINKYVPRNERDSISKKSYVITNGIDEFWFNNDPDTRSMENGTIRILHVGNVIGRKNLLLVVKAKEIIQKRGYEVELTVVGEIIDKKLYSKIKKIDSTIRYKGQLNRDDLLIEYRNHNMLVVPSKTETFGLVYAEALSQGLPIIYTRNQGFDGNFPEGQVGYSVNSSDEKELADKIIKITKEYDRISAKLKDASQKFNWITISKQYVNIYRGIFNVE